MSQLLSFEALVVLDAIDRRGSFAAAAEELNRAPSSLSYQVQKLEQDLDLMIFDRSGHRASFTKAGQLLLERGRMLILAAEEIVADANVIAHGWELDLTIAFDGLIDASDLFPMVELLGKKSKTRVKLQEEILAGCWEALTQDRADILIAPMPMVVPSEVKIEAIGKIDSIWVAAPEHPIHSESEPLLPETRSKYRGIAAADTARQAPPLSHNLLDEQPRLTVSCMSAKKDAIVAGLGIGTLPTKMIAPLIESGSLKVIHGAEEAGIDLVIAWRRNRMGKAKSWCVNYLKKNGV